VLPIYEVKGKGEVVPVLN